MKCMLQALKVGLVPACFVLGLILGASPTLTVGQDNPQPAILGAASASDRAVVFPDPGGNPNNQLIVPGLPSNVNPHGVAYFGTDNALISDFLNSRIFVVQISTATLIATINTAGGYDGTGSIVVAPDRSTALTMGGLLSNTLYVIRAPFDETAQIETVVMPGHIRPAQTQGIVFDNTGRAYLRNSVGISVLDAPYTSIQFTIPTPYSDRGSIAITPDGNTILSTTLLGDNQVRIFNAPFSAASTPAVVAIPNATGYYGINITPDGSTAIVVASAQYYAAFIRAPFTSSSVVETVPLPAGNSGGFEDIGISADGQLAILTGNSTTQPAVLIRAPFTAAETQTSNLLLQGVTNPNRGNGAVRFLPPGLAPGLTIEKSAAETVPSGSNLTYTITYGNTGTLNANNVVISDPLPAGTTFVSAGNGGTLNGGNVVFNVGTVAAGTTGLTVSFTVNVTAASGSSVNNNNYTIAATGVTAVPGPPVATEVTTSVCPDISLSPSSLPSETVGAAYSQSITASGGAAPYGFAVTAGALPAGLSLSGGGQLVGTPTGAGISNFTITATDDNECTGARDYSITIEAAPPPPGGDVCPKGQGYWRNLRTPWPVDELTLGGRIYTRSELVQIMTTPIRGDASLILASQLIPAKLNIAAGSDPGPVAAEIAAADALLSGLGRLPLRIAPSSTLGQQMTSIASTLDAYNNGELTPDCSETPTPSGKKVSASARTGAFGALRPAILQWVGIQGEAWMAD